MLRAATADRKILLVQFTRWRSGCLRNEDKGAMLEFLPVSNPAKVRKRFTWNVDLVSSVNTTKSGCIMLWTSVDPSQKPYLRNTKLVELNEETSHVPATDALVWPSGTLGRAAFLGICTSALAILRQKHKGPILVAKASTFSLAYAVGGIVGSETTVALLNALPDMTFAFVSLLGIIGALALAMRNRKS